MKLIKPSYEILTDLDEIPKIIERAGRVCYKSESKIKEGTAAPFCKMLIGRGHESVIEHASIMVKFVVDRGVSHELVRHRLASFSQESTRYCCYDENVTFIIPPWCEIEVDEPDPWDLLTVDCVWYDAMLAAEANYKELLKLGWKPEQARTVLPNSLKTELIVTANAREWRHILKLRTAEAAHPQMREIMLPLRTELAAKLPCIFETASP